MLVTPLPGVQPDTVLDLLTRRRDQLGGFHGDGTLFNYLEWTTETAIQLRQHVRGEDADRLVFSPRQAELRVVAWQNQRIVDALLNLEISDRVEAFSRAINALGEQIRRWNSVQGVLTVVDTSVFMAHPDKIENLDFAAQLHLQVEPIRIVLPIVVIDELDRLKETGPDIRRWRAGYTLAVLDRLLQHPRTAASLRPADFTDTAVAEHGPRGEVTVEVFLDNPGHVRLPSPDDEIIDRALAIQALAGRPARLLTMDTGMAMRARMVDLHVHKILREPGPEPDQPAGGRATRRQAGQQRDPRPGREVPETA